jgi:predicted ribosomally synthesized peptide with SipW-like signal peptide
MKKALIINVLIIVLVASLSIAATFAYFSGVDQSKYADVTTAKVGVGGTDGFPLEFFKLLPGDTQTKDIYIQNIGNVPEDFYVQMMYDDLAHMNFCYPKNVVMLSIKDEWNNDLYTGSICNLYSYSDDVYPMWIPKLADDVPANGIRKFTVSMTLAPSAGNFYQNGRNFDYINLIGVQWNGPAPVAAEGKFWPVGDPNYE